MKIKIIILVAFLLAMLAAYLCSFTVSEREFAVSVLRGSIDAGTVGLIGNTADDGQETTGVEALGQVGAGIPVFKPQANTRLLELIDMAEKAGAVAVGVDLDGVGSTNWEREGRSKVLTLIYDSGEDPPTEQEKAGARKDMEGYHGITFTVTLPGTITEAPGAEIKGNTAIWDIPWERFIDEGITRLEMKAATKLSLWERLFGG